MVYCDIFMVQYIKLHILFSWKVSFGTNQQEEVYNA